MKPRFRLRLCYSRVQTFHRCPHTACDKGPVGKVLPLLPKLSVAKPYGPFVETWFIYLPLAYFRRNDVGGATAKLLCQLLHHVQNLGSDPGKSRERK